MHQQEISAEAMAVLVDAARDGNTVAGQLLTDLGGPDLIVPRVIREAREARPFLPFD